jgi:hypothetical protein
MPESAGPRSVFTVSSYPWNAPLIICPKEITCFSYDENHQFRLDASSLRYYYPAILPADLSRGFDAFRQLDDTNDDHLDGLVDAIAAFEKEKGAKAEADIVTWRGMMTKVWGLSKELVLRWLILGVDHGGAFLSAGWLGDECNVLPGLNISRGKS